MDMIQFPSWRLRWLNKFFLFIYYDLLLLDCLLILRDAMLNEDRGDEQIIEDGSRQTYGRP